MGSRGANATPVCVAAKLWEALGTKHLVHVACTPFGKWTVQSMIESLVTEDEIAAMQRTLTDRAIFFMFEERDGAHVIGSLVTSFAPESKQFIYDAAVSMGSVALHHAHPLYTSFTNIFVASLSEATTRPNPRSATSWPSRGTSTAVRRCSAASRPARRLAQGDTVILHCR